jgi:hypothetical protein
MVETRMFVKREDKPHKCALGAVFYVLRPHRSRDSVSAAES